MVDILKVTEYAQMAKVSPRSVRNWIEKKKLNTTTQSINNKDVLMIIIDDKAKQYIRSREESELSERITIGEITEENKESELSERISSLDSPDVQEAEFIKESTQYNLVSMENTTFEQLIDKITHLAEAKSDAKEEYIKKLEEELYERRAKTKELEDENKKLIYQNAELDANYKIMQVRVKELEERFEKDIQEKNILINKLTEKQINTEQENQAWWSKKL